MKFKSLGNPTSLKAITIIHGFGTNVSGVEDTNIPYWSKNSALGIVKQRIELIHLD